MENHMAKNPKIQKTGFQDNAKAIFGSFNTNVLYFTADGMSFLDEKQAKTHANSLTNKEISIINRNDI